MPERTRTVEPWREAVAEYADLDAFESAADCPGGLLSIMHRGLPVDVLNEDRGADTTLVCFNSALTGPMVREAVFPMFTGRGVTADLPVNRVFVNDPSMYLSDELQLAWYAGNWRQPDLQDAIARIVRRIARSHGREGSRARLVLFGVSGGGFAALQTATSLPGSTVVPVNPQTDLVHYAGSVVRDYTRLAWRIHEEEYDPLAFVPAVTDLTSRYALPVDVSVRYVQNVGDRTHVRRHYSPFMAAAKQAGNDVAHVLVDSGRGHVPAAKHELAAVLRAVVEGAEMPRLLD